METLSKSGAWTAPETEAFLKSFVGPIRVAVTTASSFPLICSLWYQYAEGRIYCATQADAAIVRHVKRDGKCAFEFSPNEPPYFGVRGRGVASVFEVGGADLLEQVSTRYLGAEDSLFRRWLRKRADNEVRLVISPTWITTWDYRDRMTGEIPGR